jgi:hypothetical protein
MQVQLEGLRIRHGDLEGVITNHSAGSVREVRLALIAGHAGERPPPPNRALELWDLYVAIPAHGRRFFRCRLSSEALNDDDQPDARIVSVVDG